MLAGGGNHRRYRKPARALLVELAARFGAPSYNHCRRRRPPRRKAALFKLFPEWSAPARWQAVSINARLTAALGNGASIGGLEAARPITVEPAASIRYGYATRLPRSFPGEEHRKQIEKEAVEIVSEVLVKRLMGDMEVGARAYGLWLTALRLSGL